MNSRPRSKRRANEASRRALRQADTDALGVKHPPTGRRRNWLIFLGIVAFAFALRLVYTVQLRHSPLFDAPQMDALYHDQWARAIAAGEDFVAGPFFRAPLYPYFLALIYKVFGPGALAPRIVQGLLGSLSCGLVFLIGLRAFGRRIGLVAGLVAATYWVLIYFDGELLIPSLIVFLDLLLILLLMRAADRPTGPAFGLAGLVMGLSAIARPNVLLFAPAVVLWLAVRWRPHWRRIGLHAAALAAGCLLPIIPVTLHNVIGGDDFVLISSQGGVNFYIGNNPDSDGTTAIVPGTPGDWWGGYRATVARAEAAAGRPLKPSEVSRYYYRQAADFIRSQPGRALELTARKLWLFWNGKEISNNQDPYFWTERFTPVVNFLPLGFAVVGPLGILGLGLCWRRRSELFPLWGFVLVYMISVVIFFCTARYRAPVLGPLILLGTYALFQLASAVRRKRWRHVTMFATVLIPSALLVNAVPGERDPTHGAQSLRLLAKAYEGQGRYDLALGPCRQAVEVDPRSLSAHNDLGKVLLQLDRPEEAARHLRTALNLSSRLRPGETAASVADVHHNLGNALRRLGDTEQAVERYRQAIRIDPSAEEPIYYYNLGNALLDLDQPGEAVSALHKAVQLDPQLQSGHYNLAWAYVRSDSLEPAIKQFEAAVRLDPRDGQAWHGLGQALQSRGRTGEAIAAFERVVQLHPGSARAVSDLAYALADAGRYGEAAALLDRALKLDDPGVRNDLAWLLATCPEQDVRNGARAVQVASELCPDFATCDLNFLDTLAAALAENGEFDRAAAIARQALERARRASRREFADRLAARLRLYEAKEAYREP